MKIFLKIIRQHGLRILTASVFIFCVVIVTYTIRFIVTEEKISTNDTTSHQTTIDKELFTKTSTSYTEKISQDATLPENLRDPFSPPLPPPTPPPSPEQPSISEEPQPTP